MSFNDLNTSKKFVVGFAGVVTVVAVMCGSVYFAMSRINMAVTENDRSVAQLDAARDTLAQLIERQNAVRGYAISADPSFTKKIEEAGQAAHANIARWEASAPEDATQIRGIKAELESIFADQDRQVAEASNPATRQLALDDLSKKGRLTKIRELMKANIDQETAVLKRWSKAQTDDYRFAVALLAVGSVLSVLLSILMGWLLTRAIAKPISAMTDAMGRLAAGDNTVEIPAMGRKDEVGSMAEAVQTFKVAAVEKLRLEGEAADQRRLTEEQRRAAEAERAAIAEQQAKVVEGLATGLERLAAGVLTFRLNSPFAAEYEKLRSDFNGAIEQMQHTIREVAVNAAGVRTASSEISQASDNLSRRTEQQAASLEETAAALDEITATVRKTAEGAGQARDSVGSARADAERSGVVVRDAVAAMSEIESSAQQISQIIGVIDEIAFQTNLLALNAGVEAARAGDAGRGFAVVASEVRALAQRSADAAKEIKALISASSQQVDRGVSLVGETGKVLERIVTQVTQINGVVTEIAASAEEQATGLQQVNTAVNQMDQVTQQNAAMVEQATAASHSLSTEAETLARLISRFELGDTPKSHTAPAHAPAQPAPRAPVAAMKTVGRGGAARKVETAEEAWDEF